MDKMVKTKIILLSPLGLLVLLLTGSLFADSFFPSFESQRDEVNGLVNNWQLTEAAEKASRLYDAYPNNTEVIKQYGDILFAKGELHAAKEIMERLMVVDRDREHHYQLRIAMIHYYLGELETAERLVHKITMFAQEASDSSLLARSFHILGRIKFNQAEYDQSLDLQEKSLKLARSISSNKKIADALRQIGVIYWYRGDNEKARDNYDEALKIYKEMNDKIGEATTISNIGHLSGTDDWQINLEHQLIAYDIRKRIGNQVGLADSYYFLAMMPLFGRESKQLRYTYLEKSYEISNKIEYKWGKENALLALINSDLTHLNSDIDNKYSSGLNRKYFESIDSLSGLSVEGEMQLLLGNAFRHAKAGEYEKASEYFLQVHTMRDSLGYDLYRVLALSNYAKSLIKLGKFKQAETSLQNALKIAESRENERDVALISLYLAEVCKQTGRFEEARDILMNLAEFYDDLFIEIIEETHPLTGFQSAVTSVDSWRGKRSDVYELLVDVLDELNDPRLFYYIERERSMPFWGSHYSYEFTDNEKTKHSLDEFINLLSLYDESPKDFESIQPLIVQIGEMHQAIASQDVQSTYGLSEHSNKSITNVEELKEVLEPSEVFLSYFVSSEKLYAYVVRNDREAVVEFDLTEKQLRSVTEVYMNSLMRGYANPGDDLWRASSHKLYVQLVEPLLSDSLIRENETIIISPHKSLHLIPFHALPKSENLQDPEFLLDRFYISYIPSASIFYEKRTRDKQPLEHCLAVAPDVQTLPFSYEEVTEIPSYLFSKIEYLTGEEAVSDRILNNFNNYDVVHISSHTNMNFMFPNASYIRMADRKLRLHELFNKKMDTQLVILSSCGSGLGMGTMDSIPLGYDLVSFPRVFLQAGVSTVIATLWLVEDETAMMIMQNFYKNLSEYSQRGQSYNFSKALIDAQRQYLRTSKNSGEESHPFFWAPFLLVGDI